jgi:hypothetical protein
MSANAVSAPYDWSKESTEEGDEIYTLKWKVETTAVADGPDVAWTAPGLPYPGASLNVGNTVNPWAFFQGKGSAKLLKQDVNRKWWDLTTVFNTKPITRCSQSKVDDPLLEPHRVRGSFTQVMEEAIKDNSGNVIENSVKQRFTGPQVQRPKSYPTVELEMNVAWINLAWMAEYADSVNNNVQWGQPIRTIKCTVGPWERVLYGSCYYYFVVRFTFELRYETWDVILPNIADRYRITGTTPYEYAAYKTEDEENTKGFVDTDGYKTATANFLTFRVLREKDFSIVGWPATLI